MGKEIVTAALGRSFWFNLYSAMPRRVLRYLLLCTLWKSLLIGGRADVILDWNALMIDAIRVDNSGPTLSARNLAVLHTAIHDAVNSVLLTHQPYRFQVEASPETSPEAAAVGAAYEIMKVLYQPFKARSDALYQSWLPAGPLSVAIQNGLELGRRVAVLSLQNRAADGSATEVPYIPSDAPGQWRRTAPFFRPPLTPHWRAVVPFCLAELSSFLPPPPPALNSAEYAEAFNEVKEIGSKSSTIRTAEQSEIAVFWSDFSYTAMPPGHWHLIAATIAQEQNNSLAANARLFALLSVAQADAAIVCWEAKYRYNLWRPITAIQRADEDENPDTAPAADWDHYLAAPPFPAYTSGHSTFSKASAQVITHFYGTDAITFSATSDSLPGRVRTFNSLAACADEIGMSRIYGGIHFQFDNVSGKWSGGKIGDYVAANFLLANDSLPLARLEGFENGTALVRVHGHFGRACVLEASNDLIHWQRLPTPPPTPGGVVVKDPVAEGQAIRFYRAVESEGTE